MAKNGDKHHLTAGARRKWRSAAGIKALVYYRTIIKLKDKVSNDEEDLEPSSMNLEIQEANESNRQTVAVETTNIENSFSHKSTAAKQEDEVNNAEPVGYAQDIHSCLLKYYGVDKDDFECMDIETAPKADDELDYQNKLSTHINAAAAEEMRKVAAEEAKLAIEHGDVDQLGHPVITVVADEAWSKRSYRTNYNALSGVACIVGFETQKVISEKEHTRFKNWNKDSSTAMESEIILEGFCKLIAVYGLIYGRLVDDEDSSVSKKIRETLPYGTDTIVLNSVHKTVTGEPAGFYTSRYCEREKKRKQRRIANAKTHPPKGKKVCTGTNEHYGPDASISLPRMLEEEYNKKSEAFLLQLQQTNRKIKFTTKESAQKGYKLGT
ncbi:hypothetical protein ILUMI_20397 [Ignelater luminosus]|uniref:Mutator-like transposase domain-containing protein n=1 Tax=Ignelater luminosus TaxID=2038154 RepID=A0A8K0G2B6_IGNLU|nr:hypothetical protein ILUMI_20397 [Ignelater luminosus]